MTRISRSPVFRLLAISVALVVSLGCFDLLLRSKWVPMGLQNYAFSRYDYFPGGMYFLEPATKVNFMWPSIKIRAFWNGYGWTHRSDQRGFRNPPGIGHARNLLLGDSIIYGHGVEENDTVAHVLRTDFNYMVYDMSRQGACLYDQYVFLRLYLDDLAPERVILFVFGNDISDLKTYRSPEFIESMPELREYDYTAIKTRVGAIGNHPPPRILSRIVSEPLIRLIRRVFADFREKFRRMSLTSSAEAGTLLSGKLPLITDSDPVARYYDRIFRDLSRRCREGGSLLEIVYLDFGDSASEMKATAEGPELQTIVRETCLLDNLIFCSTTRLFDGCPECFLPHDGHLSGKGARRLSRFLHRKSLLE